MAQSSNLAQKCDASRPCTTCVVSKSASECIYDNKAQLGPANIYASRRTPGLPRRRPGGADPVEVSTITSTNSPTDVAFPNAAPPSGSNLLPSTSGTTLMVTHEPSAKRVFKAGQVTHGRSSGFALVRRNSPVQHHSLDTNPSISILSSFLLPTIPPEPRIPLSFLGEDRLRVQISDITATDMDMRSYVPE